MPVLRTALHAPSSASQVPRLNKGLAVLRWSLGRSWKIGLHSVPGLIWVCFQSRILALGP